MSKKLIAIASTGGHYVQLSRIMKQANFDSNDILFVRTKVNEHDTPSFENESLIEDVSRDTLARSPIVAFQLLKLILKHKPKWIVTTGAMPGLICIVIGRILLRKTMWVDSIANTKQLSASGRMAKKFAHKTLTQWPDLAGDNVEYKGRVI
jgi:UDP-N-acetylglucosamine:LPS N-acetylglucosamine transferase